MNDNINILQKNIDQLTKTSLNIHQYNDLLISVTNINEFAATVYIYDDILKNKIKPNEKTYKIIEKLHSKTLPENNYLVVPSHKNSLKPRRRIHKIIKGHKYTDKYKNALHYLDISKKYLLNNKKICTHSNKIFIAKQISKNCNISLENARFIVTKLKRINFFDQFNNQTKITNFIN